MSFEYDAADNTETVYDKQRNELLSIRHDSAGRVLNVIPRGAVDGINVTYDRQGRWTQWSRGELTISRSFDQKTGRLIERKISPRAVYRYSYKNGTKVCLLTRQCIEHMKYQLLLWGEGLLEVRSIQGQVVVCDLCSLQ